MLDSPELLKLLKGEMRVKYLHCARNLLVALGLAVFLPAMSVAQTPVFKTHNASETPRLDTASSELIVRLRAHPGAPFPADVVEAVNSNRHVPGGLSIGGPLHAEYLIPGRLTGRMAAFYSDNPDLPRARLERSIVLRYPHPEAAHGTLTALEANPNVEFVEVNRPVYFTGTQGANNSTQAERPELTQPPPATAPVSKGTTPGIIPNDPFFALPASNDPTEYQWGSYAMRLPEAWEHVRGHAKVLVIDVGIQTDHPDLRAFGPSGPFSDAFVGGNYRDHLSFEYTNLQCSVLNHVHGTHTSGIVAATPNNGVGVAGACWNCPIALGGFGGSSPSFLNRIALAIADASDKGMQVVTMSFGIPEECPTGSTGGGAICNALDGGQAREILHAASAGNDLAEVELPGIHVDVTGIGAVDTNLDHWDRRPENDCNTQAGVLNSECGANYSLNPSVQTLDLVAPGQHVLSTVWVGNSYTDLVPYSDSGCGDAYPADGDPSNDADGYGTCTGTSMSSPYVAGILALLRTANPLLTRGQIRAILEGTASQAGNWDQFLGYGVPDAAEAVETVFGTVNGQTVENRATPMFRMYSSMEQTHLFTTSPQGAVAEIEGPGEFDPDTASPPVPGYTSLPGATSPEARAAFYLFTSPQAPDGSAATLRPLYRLTRDRSDGSMLFCGNGTLETKRAWGYTISAAQIRTFHSIGGVGDNVIYFPEGIEGYIYPTSASPPTGAEKLYRYYNADLDDWLLLLESESAPAGYDDTLTAFGGAPTGEWLGWVLPNLDSDGDGIIDAWESILGTGPTDADSDNDGCTDGEELLGYVNPSVWQPSDPLDSFCPLTHIFTDGFESGDTTAWTNTAP